MPIYLDNANSTHPKPKEMLAAINETASQNDVIPGDGYMPIKQKNISKVVSTLKKHTSELFGVHHDEMMVTTSASKALFNLMSGFVESGDRLVIGEAEPQPILHAARELEKHGVTVVRIPYEQSRGISMTALKKSLAGARMLVLSHSNNVTGAILPIDEIAKLANDNHVIFLLDASHTAGRIPINFKRLGIQCAVVSGHKFLYGPTGTGLAYVDSESMKNPTRIVKAPRTFTELIEDQTPNILGFAGLNAAIKFITTHDIAKIRQHDRQMREAMIGALEMCRRAKMLAPDANEGVATISFTCKEYPPNVIARLLEERYDIQVGNGLCFNKGIHESLSTFPDGAVRVSTGYFNTQSDVEYFASSLTSILYSK
jgi:selenocysteine lyase/cysteine desulfurase